MDQQSIEQAQALQKQPGGMAVNSFNGIMHQFLSELVQLMPTEDGLRTTFDAFKIMANDPTADGRRKPAILFMSKAAEHQDLIQSKNEKFITHVSKTIPFFQTMNLEKYWKDFDDDQKEGMWEFLNMMLMLGTTILSIPPHMAQAVENMATSMMQDPEKMKSVMSNLGYGA